MGGVRGPTYIRMSFDWMAREDDVPARWCPSVSQGEDRHWMVSLQWEPSRERPTQGAVRSSISSCNYASREFFYVFLS